MQTKKEHNRERNNKRRKRREKQRITKNENKKNEKKVHIKTFLFYIYKKEYIGGKMRNGIELKRAIEEKERLKKRKTQNIMACAIDKKERKPSLLSFCLVLSPCYYLLCSSFILSFHCNCAHSSIFIWCAFRSIFHHVLQKEKQTKKERKERAKSQRKKETNSSLSSRIGPFRG